MTRNASASAHSARAPRRVGLFAGALAVAALLPDLALAAAKEPPLPAELPPFAADKAPPVPEIQESKLPNGLTVWLLPRPGIPKVSAVLAVRGGTASDPAGMEGTASLLADALREGTKTRSSQQIAEEIQAIGGSLGTSASDDALFVTADALAHAAPRLVEILADVVQNPSFPASEVELVKANAMQGLMAQKSQPEFAVNELYAKTLFGSHPYHITHAPEAAIQAVTPEYLRAQHQARFRPDRGLLLLIGAFDPKKLGAEVNKRFTPWKASGEAAALPAPAPTEPGRKILLIDRPGSIQSNVRVGRPGITQDHPDYFPLLVANTIYGGSFGSRLTTNIREDKGYTYSPGASVTTYAVGGEMTTQAAVRTEVTGASLLEIVYELDRMGATEPLAEELARAKRYQVGLYLLRNQISGLLANTLVGYWVKNLPPQALADHVAKIEAVDAAAVQRVGRQYLRSRDMAVVIGGDLAKIKEQVEPFGAVEVVPAAN
jgi:zinc protease